MEPIVTVSRVATFCSAHRLNSNLLSKEENEEIFGKCNNPHGHNYSIQVFVRGPVSPVTGMVMNLRDLKSCLEIILPELDHKNLDIQVPFFKNRPSTAENIAYYLYCRVKKELGYFCTEEVRLQKVVVWETQNNCAEYYE